MRQGSSKFARWLARPPLVGAAYVLALAAWAARAPAVQEREVGAQARQLEAFVYGKFGGEITRIGVALAAAAIALGAVIGAAAGAILWARDRIRRSEPHSVRRRAVESLAMVAALHGAFELWAMARDPQLYASAWYARGGWRRATQVFATDVLGPRGVVLIALVALVVFLVGPPSGWARLVAEVRSRFARIAAAGAALAGLGAIASLPTPAVAVAAAHASAPDDPRPNILVLAADSLRADRLEARTAPHLSALAARGTRFDRAYVSLPRTFPSWVTILTGLHPHHHGIRSMFPRWEERAHDFDAVPERLSRAGWSTAVVSDYAGDVFSRIDLGFGSVDVPEFDFRQLVRQHALERETPLLPVLHSRIGRAAFPAMRELNDAADPSLLAAGAARTLRTLQSRGQPFMMLVFFSTAHFPYAAPAPYYARFTDRSYRGRFKYHKPVGLGREPPADARDERQVRALYDGAVLAIDDAAQSILGSLDAATAHKTIVVVTADHGETLYDNGHGHGHGDHLLGDEGTHVPLVIFDPRKSAPHRDMAIVRDVDIAPTLYALTGVPAPDRMDGRSLARALDGEPLAPALAYAETGLWFTEDIAALPSDMRLPYPGVARMTEIDTQHGGEVVLRKDVRPLTIVAKHRMVRDDRYKLVYAPTRAGVRWVLYDTKDDPGETRDVASTHPDVLARLRGELWSWMRGDADMVEHGGYLLPREASARPPASLDVGLMRLDDNELFAPPAQAAP